MYAYINGEYKYVDAGSVVIECNGIGYTLLMPKLPAWTAGDKVKVFTYLYVREDIFELYGFASQEQLNLFKMLIGVNKIGPKLALQILGSITPEQFALAILRNDLKILTSIKGLGKKNAERLVIDLRDKLKKAGSPQAKASTGLTSLETQEDTIDVADDFSAVVEALTLLGYDYKTSVKQAKAVFDPELDLNQNIRLALRGFDRTFQ